MSQGKKIAPPPSLFVPAVGLYDHIPKNHFYEQLNRVLDLSFVRELMRPLYAEKLGRPSLDPVVFFKCLLVGFFENITHDTELEYRIADSLTFRKFLGYSLEERTPDESTLRKTRQRMPEELFRAVFDRVLDMCQGQGLVKWRAVGVDSTPVEANASMDSLRHRELGCTYEEYMLALKRQESPGASVSEAKQADRERPGKASNADWVSPTDSEARVAQHPDKHTHLSYKVDTSVDLETGVIVSVGAEAADVSDQSDFLGKVDEVVLRGEERGFSAPVIVADKGHHSGENLAALEERGVVGVVSSPRNGRGAVGYRQGDFKHDEETDTLECPAGQTLVRVEKFHRTHRRYQAKGDVCRVCPHFGVCTRSKEGRGVSISLHDGAIRRNRERCYSEGGRALLGIRRQRGEGPFGYFKQFGGMRRMSGRGLSFVWKKALMAGAGWNLLILLKNLALQGPSAALSAVFGTVMAALWLLQVLTEASQGPLLALRNPIALPHNRQSRACQNPHLSGGC